VGSWRGRAVAAIVALVFALALAGQGTPAARTTSNLKVTIVVGRALRNIPEFQNGESTAMHHLAFRAGVNVASTGPDEANVRVRFELPAGLHWGFDLPDPTENCTATITIAECRTPQPLFTVFPNVGWAWDVFADAPGTYVLKGAVIESSAADPDPSDNAASVTVVVTQPTVAASAVKISPARPRAGSVVSARVGVTAEGVATTPSGVRCAGTVGARRIAATASASNGTATCRYRTPKAGRRKTLRGTISFTAEGAQLTRQFAVRLR
jgi:hypothetical protein